MQSRKNRDKVGGFCIRLFSGLQPSPERGPRAAVIHTFRGNHDAAVVRFGYQVRRNGQESPFFGRAISLDVSWATRDVSSATRDVSWVTRETSWGCAVLGIHDRPGGRFSTPPGGDSQRGMFGGYAGLRLRRQELHRGRWHPIGRRANSMACVTGSRPNPYIDRFDTFLCRKRALVSCP